MFNHKDYIEVNREERFFCFLLAHTLLSSESARIGFLKIWRDRFSPRLPTELPLQVFVEAAALRDYWFDLGNHKKYTAELGTARHRIVAAVLAEEGMSERIIDEHDFFWSSSRRVKLVSPGKWREKQIRSAGLDALLPLKWAVNAKPDLLLICGSEVLIIEAKIESGEGRSAAGYVQNTTQVKIATLLRLLVPRFCGCNFEIRTLGLKKQNDIRWDELAPIIKGSGIDEFTERCFAILQRYNPRAGL